MFHGRRYPAAWQCWIARIRNWEKRLALKTLDQLPLARFTFSSSEVDKWTSTYIPFFQRWEQGSQALVTCSAWLLERLPCSCLLALLLGLEGARTPLDEDTLGDVVDFDQDIERLFPSGWLLKKIRRQKPSNMKILWWRLETYLRPCSIYFATPCFHRDYIST